MNERLPIAGGPEVRRDAAVLLRRYRRGKEHEQCEAASGHRYMIFFCAARARTTASARNSKAPAIMPDVPS